MILGTCGLERETSKSCYQLRLAKGPQNTQFHLHPRTSVLWGVKRGVLTRVLTPSWMRGVDVGLLEPKGTGQEPPQSPAEPPSLPTQWPLRPASAKITVAWRLQWHLSANTHIAFLCQIDKNIDSKYKENWMAQIISQKENPPQLDFYKIQYGVIQFSDCNLKDNQLSVWGTDWKCLCHLALGQGRLDKC